MDCPDVSRVFKGRALFCEKVKKSAKILAGEIACVQLATFFFSPSWRFSSSQAR